MMRSARIAGVAHARTDGSADMARMPWLSGPIDSLAVARWSPSGP